MNSKQNSDSGAEGSFLSKDSINPEKQSQQQKIVDIQLHADYLKQKTHQMHNDQSRLTLFQQKKPNQQFYQVNLRLNLHHDQSQDNFDSQKVTLDKILKTLRLFLLKGQRIQHKQYSLDLTKIPEKNKKSSSDHNSIHNCQSLQFNQQPRMECEQDPQLNNHKISHLEVNNIRKNDRFDSMKIIIDNYTKSPMVKRKLKENLLKKRSFHYIFYWVVYMAEEGEDIDILHLWEKSSKVIEERSRDKGNDYYEALKESVDRMIIAVGMFKQGQRKEAIDFSYTKGQPIEKIHHKSKKYHEECLKIFVPMYHQTNKVA